MSVAQPPPPPVLFAFQDTYLFLKYGRLELCLVAGKTRLSSYVRAYMPCAIVRYPVNGKRRARSISCSSVAFICIKNSGYHPCIIVIH